MTVWDGRGLPPVAQARVERAAAGRLRTSLFAAREAATLRAVGLDPVGDVMGCVVEHIGWGGYGCGAYVGTGIGRYAYAPPTLTSGMGGYAGYAPYVDALYYGFEVALHRMLLEAQALGADGVVGVRWTQERIYANNNREFVALGTAVRARGGQRPAHLFATDLAGQDVVKLMHGGWMPSGLVIGIAVAVRHDDYYTRQQAMSWTNVEVTGYTELVTFARADARAKFAERAAKHGGDAAIVSDMAMNVWALEPGENHRDHVVESVVTGSALAKFHRGAQAPTDALMMLPLVGTDRRRRP
ncbi:MAG: heavy metal-binding domain-containing protein [Frankiaceae bacterium]|nr:heavy metal-binding domain-containing protein [Frankiaceae bacterium]